MEIAIITGSSSGIGNSIARRLLARGYIVYGFGRDFSGDELTGNENYHQIKIDLKKHNDLEYALKKIIAEKGEAEIKILVNNAGVGYYGPHEQINADRLHEMVAVNLEAPLIAASLLLREFKASKGYIFNISSVTASKENVYGCAYGATKAGLSSFGKSLFEEVRKYGVKVINIQPDMTATKLYRSADFCQDEAMDAHLEPDEVAELVDMSLSLREGLLITEYTLKPQLHKIYKKYKGKEGIKYDT